MGVKNTPVSVLRSFRWRNGMAKIQAVNGLRVEIFVRKYYPSIVGLDRCNGDERASTIKNLHFVA